MTRLLAMACTVAPLLSCPATAFADDGPVSVTVGGVTFSVPETWLLPEAIELAQFGAIDALEIIPTPDALAQIYGGAPHPEYVQIVLRGDPVGEWRAFWIDDRLDRARTKGSPIDEELVGDVFDSIHFEELHALEFESGGKSMTHQANIVGTTMVSGREPIAIAALVENSAVTGSGETLADRVYTIAMPVKAADRPFFALIHIRMPRALSVLDFALIDLSENILNNRLSD